MWVLLLWSPSQKELLPVCGLHLWGTGSHDAPPTVSPILSQVALRGALSGTAGGAFSTKGEGFIVVCCTHHRNGQRAAVIPGDDTDSEMGRVIGDDRIAATEEYMFAHRHVLL